MEKGEMGLDGQSEIMQHNYVLIKFALFYVCIYIYSIILLIIYIYIYTRDLKDQKPQFGTHDIFHSIPPTII